MSTVDEKIERQAELCGTKIDSLGEGVSQCKAGIDEILKVVRGEGTDAGLVGHVQEHEKRLKSHGAWIRALWVLFGGALLTGMGWLIVVLVKVAG